MTVDPYNKPFSEQISNTNLIIP